MPTAKAPELEMRTFATARAFETWLRKNHAKSPGIFLRMYKKASGKKSVNYAEALDVALCYGWIDSIVHKVDAESYKQRFGPRRSRSVWSDINRGHIARLTKEGRMQPAGLAQVEAAKKDGRWANAYPSPATMQTPADLLNALEPHKKAKAFFDGLSKSNKYAIAWQLHNAKKPETRERRLKKFVAMLKRGEKSY